MTLNEFNSKFKTNAKDEAAIAVELYKQGDIVVIGATYNKMYMDALVYEVNNIYKIKINNFYIAFSKRIYVVEKDFSNGIDKKPHYAGEKLKMAGYQIVNNDNEPVFLIGSSAYKNNGNLIKVME